jgi:hypothetical protein
LASSSGDKTVMLWKMGVFFPKNNQISIKSLDNNQFPFKENSYNLLYKINTGNSI